MWTLWGILTRVHTDETITTLDIVNVTVALQGFLIPFIIPPSLLSPPPQATTH